MKVKLFIAVFLLLTSAASATLLDDFNRPNNPDLGPNWTLTRG